MSLFFEMIKNYPPYNSVKIKGSMRLFANDKNMNDSEIIGK